VSTYRLVNGFALIILCLFLWRSMAQAQDSHQSQQAAAAEQSTEQGSQVQPSFKQLDSNGDGYLNWEEAQQIITQKQTFSDADANEDGRLSKQEVEKAGLETTTSETTWASKEVHQKAAKEEKGRASAGAEQSPHAGEATSVQVQQQEPEVTVSQPAPQVIVEQPTPKVIVKQPDPNVTVQQHKPDVIVKQPGQPEVIVKQTEQPDVKIIEETGASSALANQLYKMEVGDVVGQDIVTADGETIGEIEQVVLHSGDEQLYVVVPVGGFLGIGEKDVVVPFSELELRNDQITIMTAKSEEQLKQQPDYDPKEYVALEDEHAIKQFADTQSSK
jgi:sporulation protein YlmC with PRC-barrel domain